MVSVNICYCKIDSAIGMGLFCGEKQKAKGKRQKAKVIWREVDISVAKRREVKGGEGTS
jgi:hypothetical protein